MPATVASCHVIGLAIVPSVAAIALFEPLVAPVVVAEGFPEPRLVAVLDPKTTDPFGALPEVASRNDEPGRAAVLRCQRLAVVFPRDERLAVQDVAERKVRRVAAIRVGDQECGLGVEVDALEERVDADAAPVHV